MRISCVHQGYEMYGSDRCFVETVSAIRAAYPQAEIEVVLPRQGPIVDLLAGLGVTIVFEPLWILRRRNLLRLATIGLLGLPAACLRAARRFRRSDLVYINTTVVTDYILASRFFPGRAILHAHEIAEGASQTILRSIVRWSGARVVFNSCATRDAFALPAGHDSQVIYNGVAGPPDPEPTT